MHIVRSLGGKGCRIQGKLYSAFLAPWRTEMLKVGSWVGFRLVTGLGDPEPFSGGHLVPAQFWWRTWGIVKVGSSWLSRGLWIPRDEAAKLAIEGSMEAPLVGRGIGAGVIRVKGVDRQGPYTVSLYYNDKADYHDDRVTRPQPA